MKSSMTIALRSVALGLSLMSYAFPLSTSAQTDLFGEALKFQFAVPAGLSKDSLRRLYATAYFVQPATQTNDSADPVILGSNGESLGIRIKSSIWCRAAVEGSLLVHKLDGTQQGFKYSGVGNVKVTDCNVTLAHMNPTQVVSIEKSTFKPTNTDAPYGIGACQEGVRYRLVPHRSIAIDAKANAPLGMGQVIFIPRLRGAKIVLPDGTQRRHDGYVMAVDTGGSIKGRHIDYFKGPAPNDHLLSQLAPKEKLFDAYVITDSNVHAIIKKAHTISEKC